MRQRKKERARERMRRGNRERERRKGNRDRKRGRIGIFEKEGEWGGKESEGEARKRNTEKVRRREKSICVSQPCSLQLLSIHCTSAGVRWVGGSRGAAEGRKAYNKSTERSKWNGIKRV